jgi:hypothetical protein
MNNFHFSIGNLVMVVLFLFGFNSAALAAGPVSGKVVKVDPNAHTFTVQYSVNGRSARYGSSGRTSRERTFKTTDQTTYWVGSTKGSWANVTKGVRVTVTANAGVAGKVQIPGS